MKPNYKLRHAREQRGWSQAKVALELGIDPITVSRWERGISRPYPHFREKLSALFETDAASLGLLSRSASLPDKDEPFSSSIAPSQPIEPSPTTIIDPLIPIPVFSAHHLVGRSDLLAQLIRQICSQNRWAHYALYGLPGIGKTSLAVTLAHSPRVREYFIDGVLWAGLGPQPDLFSLLSHWGTLLGLTSSETSTFQSYDDWISALRTRIGLRRILLVIDDVWQIEDAQLLRVQGPNCACLITTRFPPIAVSLADERAVSVPQLNEQDGVKLLTRFVSDVVKLEPDIALTLVQSVGGLPLALTLMGRYLQRQTLTRQPRRLFTALQRLQETELRLQLAEPAATLDRSPNLLHGSPLSLHAVIQVSDAQLDAQAQQALRSLSVFSPRPNSFTEEAALAVCHAPADVLDTLSDAGLLESSLPGRYSLHQTIADYAKVHLTDQTVYDRFIAYFLSYLETNQKNTEALELECDNILAFLDTAFKLGKDAELVRGFYAFSLYFLRLRGLDDVTSLHLQRAHQAAQKIGNAMGVVMALLQWGQQMQREGKYSQALSYALQALDLARQSDLQNVMSLIYIALGGVYQYKGEYQQSEAYLQESLDFAHKTRNDIYVCIALLIFTNTLDAQGKDTEAEAYAQECLALSRQYNHSELMSHALIQLGRVATYTEDFDQARSYVTEGLRLAQEIKHLEATCFAFNTLGRLDLQMDDLAAAEVHIRLGRELALQVGNVQLICDFYLLEGEYALEQQRFDEAARVFREALEHVPSENQALLAEVYYGQARTDAKQGDLQEACEHAMQSLSICKMVGYRKMNEVARFLDTLSLT